MPVKWDHKSERDLLFYLIDELADIDCMPKKTWLRIAKKLGNGVTDNACRQKFYKMKNHRTPQANTDTGKKGPPGLVTLSAGETALQIPQASEIASTAASTGEKRKSNAAEETTTGNEKALSNAAAKPNNTGQTPPSAKKGKTEPTDEEEGFSTHDDSDEGVDGPVPSKLAIMANYT